MHALETEGECWHRPHDLDEGSLGHARWDICHKCRSDFPGHRSNARSKFPPSHWYIGNKNRLAVCPYGIWGREQGNSRAAAKTLFGCRRDNQDHEQNGGLAVSLNCISTSEGKRKWHPVVEQARVPGWLTSTMTSHRIAAPYVLRCTYKYIPVISWDCR